LENYDYSKLTFRRVSWLDYKQFEDACRDSQKELTEFLSIGEFMHQYISMDYWNLFGALLKSKELDLFGVYEDKKILGIASIYHSSRPFGCQIVYWVRGGYHGKGIGKYFLYRLLSDALGRKGFIFVELIIDEENKASIAVAEQLELELVHSWERRASGQGKLNSGRFRMYYAFENIFRWEAKQCDMTPLELLDYFWFEMERGIDMTVFLPKPQTKFKRTTLRDSLRLVVNPNDLEESRKNEPIEPPDTESQSLEDEEGDSSSP
jgi:RimJ/RimL family protein N-acetyltransferase